MRVIFLSNPNYKIELEKGNVTNMTTNFRHYVCHQIEHKIKTQTELLELYITLLSKESLRSR